MSFFAVCCSVVVQQLQECSTVSAKLVKCKGELSVDVSVLCLCECLQECLTLVLKDLSCYCSVYADLAGPLFFPGFSRILHFHPAVFPFKYFPPNADCRVASRLNCEPV